MTKTHVPALAALVLGAALSAGCSPPPPPAPPPQAPPPPPPPAVVQAPTKLDIDLIGAQLNIKTDIEFDSSSSRIRDNQVSQTTLNAVLGILQSQPRITKLRIEGHTDSDGGAEANEHLSRERAQNVKNWLLAHGVDGKRLTFTGCGSRDPLFPNDTPANKQRNRRTEFDIESIDGKRIDGYTDPCSPNKYYKR